MATWDPSQYLRFAGERARPFFDLAGRIAAVAPSYLVDLGCGPGQLTASLADRWPDAEVLGVDSSADMIRAAEQEVAGRGSDNLSFRVQDVSDWRPERPVDVIISNALLQWVPDHFDLLPRWAGYLADDGWLAFQLPGNFDQPSHAVLRDLAESPEWRERLAGVRLNRQAGDPEQYLDLLAKAGLAVDAWETTYLHVLAGPDPVTQWYKGTGLRPVLSALDPADADEFVRQYGERVRIAYPPAPYGTVLPFRRVFVVAHRV
ncbi:MAG TPA: trans-aconitate 2-methyltransferase [Streptosporangiaceae bacterium]|nr:trans-aconitate 2-methyltransferase [Streptosporangiaceae bacterium]